MSLHDAAWNGDLEALRDRIERGSGVDGRNGNGWTPLMEACLNDHLECAQALNLNYSFLSRTFSSLNKTQKDKIIQILNNSAQFDKVV